MQGQARSLDVSITVFDHTTMPGHEREKRARPPGKGSYPPPGPRHRVKAGHAGEEETTKPCRIGRGPENGESQSLKNVKKRRICCRSDSRDTVRSI